MNFLEERRRHLLPTLSEIRNGSHRRAKSSASNDIEDTVTRLLAGDTASELPLEAWAEKVWTESLRARLLNKPSQALSRQDIESSPDKLAVRAWIERITPSFAAWCTGDPPETYSWVKLSRNKEATEAKSRDKRSAEQREEEARYRKVYAALQRVLFAKEHTEARALAAPWAIAAGWTRSLLLPSQDPPEIYQAIARDVLTTESKEEERDDGPEGRKVDELRRELWTRFPAAAAAVDLESVTWDQIREPPSEDGLLWLDARAARHFESIGDAGRDKAAELREASRRRWADFKSPPQPSLPGITVAPPEALWKLWYDPSLEVCPLRFAWLLCRVLWRDVVRPRLEERRNKPPALALVISRDLERICFEPGRVVRSTPTGPELADAQGRVIASISTKLEPAVDAAFQQLASLTAHRAIRWLITEGHLQVLQEAPNPSFIRVRGGLAAFAEEIGAASGKAREEASKVLQAGQSFRFSWPGGEVGGLWTYAFIERAGPGRAALLEIRLGSPLLPYYAKRSLPNDQQLLIPIVPLPPLVGRPRDHAPQATFQFKLVRALVEHRAELLPHGGALLREEELARLATEAGLPTSTLSKVIDRWTQDGDDGPRVLELVEKDRYMLADSPPYRDAREFLLEASRRSIKGKNGGKRAAATKARRLGKK